MPADLKAHVEALSGRRVVVAGDVVLDEYLYGRAERLSREAAIPVLEFVRRQLILGGAANPAHNIVALGSQALQFGLVGQDESADELRQLLRQCGVGEQTLVSAEGRTTTLKTRILAEVPLIFAQQLARLDRLDRRPLDPQLEKQVLALLAREAPQAGAVLCSDYGLGFLSERIIQGIRELCRAHGVLLTVDSQGRLDPYRGADLIRCNADEAALYLGRPRLSGEHDFQQALAEMLARLDAGVVIVTRGGAGCSLQGRELPYTHLPAMPVGEVFDATGAGDTFIAVVTLGLAAGLPVLDAARLANIASALVVRRIGNAVVTQQELRGALRGSEEA